MSLKDQTCKQLRRAAERAAKRLAHARRRNADIAEQRDRARRDLAEAVALLAEHVDGEPCWFDHHGYCQAHGWLTNEDRCPHARGREFLALHRTEENL